MCCRCWGQTPKGLNGPTLQHLPELVSSSSLCCSLRSSSRAEVTLVPLLEPCLLHSPHRNQVVFGGFSFKHGCRWWDSHLCVGLSSWSLPSVLPTDPFQPLPSPGCGTALPTLCQGSQRLSDLPNATRGVCGGERRDFCVGGQGHPGELWPVLSPGCSLDVRVPSCWAGLSPALWEQSRVMVSWRGCAEEPGSLLTVSPLVGLFPTGGVPGAVCDIAPQWHPLPGQLWPPAGTRQPITPSQVSPSSLRPDVPGRGSVHAQVRAGKAEPFPVLLLNHHGINEIKFTQRGFPGCRGFTPDSLKN